MPSVVPEAIDGVAGREQLVPQALTVYNSSSRAPARCWLSSYCQTLQARAVSRDGGDGAAPQLAAYMSWVRGRGAG